MTPFANRIAERAPSIVREMYKAARIPGMYHLAGGNPSPDTFPIEEMRELSDKLFAECATDPKMRRLVFQYGITEGDGDLREILRQRYIDHYNNGSRETDDLQIFTGAQQAIDLAAKCFLNTGDVVITEAISYAGAMTTFVGYEARIVGVEMDQDGMIPEKLEETLKAEPKAKLIYLIPTFQNPMGTTMPLARRQAIYDIAVKYDVMIFEDSPYFELRYSGEYVPSIKSLDKTGHVIFSGSLSKILTPGLRLGFAIASPTVLGRMTVAKQMQDLNTCGYVQQLAYRYLANYDVDAHIADCCNLYRKKRDAIVNALEKYLAGKAEFSRPEGGLFLWVYLPDEVHGDDFSRYLIDKKKVIGIPASAYRADGKDVCALRLNFSMPSVEDLDTAIKLLSEGLVDYMREHK